MKNFFILALCTALFLSSMISAQTIVPAGPVSGTWTKAKSPYRIQGNINVPVGQTLTIQPGVVVEFQGHYMLSIKGNVRASGAPGDTILFTRKDTLGFYNVEIGNGGWNGIKIDNSDGTMWGSDTSVFQFCKFQYAKSIITGNETGGGAIFNRNFPYVQIKNCLFNNNLSRTDGGAIYTACFNSGPEIARCTFINNIAVRNGGALYLEYNSAPFIRSCLFVRNKSLNGGAIHSIYGKGTILNNTFSNNIADQWGGAIFLNSSQEIITGNLIVNNFAPTAGGIKISSSMPKFFNNHICNNHAAYGGGIEFWGLCNADFFNNIIWGNTESYGIKTANQIRISSVSSTPNFYNSVIQGGIAGIPGYNGKYGNIIENDPQIISPSVNTGIDADGLNAEWVLSNTSPAINRGTNDVMEELAVEADLNGNPRIIHGIIDIGAYEKHINSIIASDTLTENTSWIADTVRITGDIVIADGVTLEIAPETYIEFQGNYKIQVQGTIKAIGLINSRIVFTVKDTTGFSNLSSDISGSWQGIIFDNSEFGANGEMSDNDSSKLVYCTIQYAKHLTFIYEGTRGSAVQIKYFSNLEISNCTIQKNIAFSGGGIGIDMYSHPLISGNIIYRNIARKDGGGIYVGSYSNPRIINNFILNNSVISSDDFIGYSGGGIQVFKGKPEILYNVICNNYADIGGAICLTDSKPLFYGNTICNNLSTRWESLHFTNSNPDIYNSIIWGNKTSNPEVDGVQIWSDHSLNFYFNNIQGGQERMFFSHEGVYQGNINSDPVFKNPTSGPGPQFDALQSDWSITDLSPNINKGYPDIGQLILTDKDIAGNKRVRHEIIDIGAFENQGDPVQIIRQPFGQLKCLGDNVEFSVLVDGTASFQWMKNGDTIPGNENNTAITNTLVLNSVTRNDIGDYICQIVNGYGMLLSYGAKLEVNSPPEILFQTESQWVREDDNIRLEIRARGTEPVFYKWKKDNAFIEEAEIPELRIYNMSLQNEGIYLCQVKNDCGTIESTPITLIVAPQICMVTVDLETGKNLVIWEKKGLAKVTEYNIYRESTVAGQYERIGNLPYDALSVFVDTVADPAKQAWIYKITATDAEGIESDIDLCKPHKTIHLITSTNVTTGDVQLSWDAYYGFEYGTYYIYRSQTLSNFSEIYSMSSSTAAYTEANPENTLYYFRVAVQKPILCYPTGSGKKADSGPYSHSMSNIEDNRFQTGMKNLKSAGELNIYPNPFNETTTLKFPNPENNLFSLRVLDLTGKVLREISNIAGSEYILERNDLQQGYYIIELSGERIYRGRIVIE
jgi:predicted outer membrane repeat protein